MGHQKVAQEQRIKANELDAFEDYFNKDIKKLIVSLRPPILFTFLVVRLCLLG